MLRALAFVACLLTACHKDTPFPTEPRTGEDVFGTLKSRWIERQALFPWSRPVVFRNTVVFATGDQRLIARDRTTGTALWSTQVTSVNGDPWVSGLNLVQVAGVIVAAVSRNFVGVDAATGTELWSYGAPPDTVGDPSGKPASVALVVMDADDSTVYLPAWGSSLSAVDARTGVPRWVWQTPAGTQFRSGAEAARVSGDTVLMTVWHNLNAIGNSTEVWLVALDRRDGHELGKAVIPHYTFGTVVTGGIELWGNLAIVTGVGGRVWAINRDTYQQAWSYQPVQAVSTTLAGPVIYDGILYTDSGDNYAIGLRPTDGSIVWRARITSQAWNTFLVTPKRVYVPEGAFLNVIDRVSGKYVARTRQPPLGLQGSLFATSPVNIGNMIYINIGGGVWCFEEP